MKSCEENNKRVLECSYQWSLQISESSLSGKNLPVLNSGSSLTGVRMVGNAQRDDQKL